MPARDTSALDRVKERLLFVVALCCLCAYAALWVLQDVSAGGATVAAGGEQRFVLAEGIDDPLPEPGSVFADGAKDTYYDEDVPPRWVMPRVEVETREPVTLELPVSTFPAPPGLLPMPSPAIENTSDLPRWPAFARPPAQE